METSVPLRPSPAESIRAGPVSPPSRSGGPFAHTPRVSIVVLNYNGEKFLLACLNSVLRSSFSDIEVVIVDNGSADNSIRLAKEAMSRDERVSLITNKENIGWSAGNNVGIRATRGQLTILLSNDTVVEEGWLEPIVRAMESEDCVGIAQPLILSIFDKRSIDSLGGFPDRLGFLYIYAPEGPVDEVFHTEGVVMCIKRSVFKDIGLLDEDFFMEWDDSDFCWRARLMNYKVVVVTDSVVYHVRGGVTGATLMTRRLSNIKRYAQNHLLSMIKNYETANMVKFVPIAVLLETGKAVFFGIKGKWGMAQATLEGLIGLPFKFQQIWTKRIGVQSTRKVRDDLILKKMVRFHPNYLKLFYDYQSRGRRPLLSRQLLLRKRP